MIRTTAAADTKRMRWRAMAFGAFALFAVVASACDGSAGSATLTAASSATAGAIPSAVASPLATRTPRALPVTPVNIEYHVVDPRFDALPGATAIFGQYEGGGYQIEVPDGWNGDVVYFAHGFRGNPPELTVTFPPIREHLLRGGYAWAASSYSKNGYEPGAAAADTQALRAVVEREVGAPRRSYIFGQSMGGHVVTFSLERYPDAYDGALAECGVVSGHEILDYFLSWGALSSYFTGADLYTVTTDAGAFGRTLTDHVVPELGPLDEPTLAGRRFTDVIQRMTGGPRPFFREGLAANYGLNFVILVNAVAAAGPANAASQNATTSYDIDPALGMTAAELNAKIGRVMANPVFRDPARYPEFAPLSGRIETPLLTLHNTGDLFVPISLEQSYRRTVDAAGAGDLLVQRAIRRAGHCMFTDAERIRAFDDLVAWVERGSRPAGDDLTGPLRDAGRTWTDPLEPDDPGGVSP